MLRRDLRGLWILGYQMRPSILCCFRSLADLPLQPAHSPLENWLRRLPASFQVLLFPLRDGGIGLSNGNLLEPLFDVDSATGYPGGHVLMFLKWSTVLSTVDLLLYSPQE